MYLFLTNVGWEQVLHQNFGLLQNLWRHHVPTKNDTPKKITVFLKQEKISQISWKLITFKMPSRTSTPNTIGSFLLKMQFGKILRTPVANHICKYIKIICNKMFLKVKGKHGFKEIYLTLTWSNQIASYMLVLSDLHFFYLARVSVHMLSLHIELLGKNINRFCRNF